MPPFAEATTADVDGLSVAYRRAGQGEPILLLHGIPTSSRLWDLVGPGLAGDFDVIAPDLVGYGRSEKPLDRDVSVSAQADLMSALMDALSIERATVVGHDIGGAVAQILTVRRAERVARLGLVDSVCFDSWPIPQMTALKRTAPLVAKLPAGWIFAALWRALERDLPEAARESLQASLAVWDRSPDALAAFLRNVEALDSSHTEAIAAELGKIGVPAHVVWGAADPYQRPEWAPRLRDAIPGATLRLVDAGHFVPWERPDELVTEIRALAARS
jgi:2-hydroxymuconate-semialdehyde hydrolase